MDHMGLRRDIHTWTTQEELLALFEIARTLPPNGTILELGSYLGASTLYLAAGSAVSASAIICVDTWNNDTIPGGPVDVFPEFLRNVAPVATRITTIRKRLCNIVPGELPTDVQLAFLDADHSYEATMQAFKLILPLVAAKATVALHDTVAFPGVCRVLGEILAGGGWNLAGHIGNLSWITRVATDPTD